MPSKRKSNYSRRYKAVSLEFGCLYYFYPDDAPKKSTGKPQCVVGSYFRTDTKGNYIFIDCVTWGGELYNDGIGWVSKSKNIYIPPQGLKIRYFGFRKKHKEEFLALDKDIWTE